MQERIPDLEMVDASKLPYPAWQTPLAATPDKWNGCESSAGRGSWLAAWRGSLASQAPSRCVGRC